MQSAQLQLAFSLFVCFLFLFFTSTCRESGPLQKPIGPLLNFLSMFIQIQIIGKIIIKVFFFFFLHLDLLFGPR